MPPEDHKEDWQDMPVKVYLDDKEIGVTTNDVTMTISMGYPTRGKRHRMITRAAKLLWRHMRSLSGKGVLVLKGAHHEQE